jgi:hypothetical protein
MDRQTKLTLGLAVAAPVTLAFGAGFMGYVQSGTPVKRSEICQPDVGRQMRQP